MSDTIKQRFDALLTPTTQEEEFEIKAGLLAMQFLSLVDQAMEERGISKKWLANEVGTSPAFITQLFRGDRKPNWNMLVRMQKALGLEFKVTTEAELRDYVRTELVDSPPASVSLVVS